MAKPINDADLASPWLRMLLYGVPGSTKTRTAGTAALDPRSAPALMLVAKGNPISIRDYPRRPTLIDIEELADFNDPYNWILEGQPAGHPFAKRFGLTPPYKTLIIDTMTEVQRLAFNVVVGKNRIGPGTIPPATERQHFNRVLDHMVRFADLHYGLPMHVILTALEREQKDEATGVVSYGPFFWGQSAEEVAGYAHIVGRMVHRANIDRKLEKEVEQSKQLGLAEDVLTQDSVSVALFRQAGKYAAKDQTGRLGAYMVDPTIPKMLDLIERK